MPKEIYYVFADDGIKDKYGLPKLHCRTSTINLNADWIMLASFLRNCGNIGSMEPTYKVPNELRKADGLRDLTVTEIEKWEAQMKEGKSLTDKLT